MPKFVRTLQLLIIIACLLLLISLPVRADVYGEALTGGKLPLSAEATLADGVYWNGSADDRVTENYFTYTPGGKTLPIVAYGSKMYGRSTITALADYVENTLGYMPIAGINGDYFSLSSGIPTGLLITEGVLRSSEHSSWPAVGFRADGSAMIGRPELDITARFNRKTVTIYNLNKAVYDTSGLTLLTDSFSATTRVATSTFNVVLSIDSGTIAIGDEISCTVLEKLTTSSPIDIAEGTAVLCAPVGAVNHTGLTSLQPGDTVTISFDGDEEWEDVLYAVGGAERLLADGDVTAPASSAAPRTALGIKADGTVLLYTVDGRQSGYSNGATLPELAKRLKELGCVDAINLDGGGSTTAAARYPGEEDFVIVNRPSGGSQRQCANFIFLVNTAPSSGVAEHLFLYPYSGYALAGAPLQFAVTATDNAFVRTSLPGAITFASDLGSIDASGRLTSRSKTGSGIVVAQGGGLTAQANITLINQPDAISLSSDGAILGDATISLLGGESIDLDAVVYYRHMEILSGDAALKWSVSGDVGSVDAEGRFTAHSYLQEGSGYVTASYGSLSAQIPVTITARGELLEDFEAESGWFNGGNSWWQISRNTDLTKVRYGYQSAKLDYTADAAGSFISLPLEFSFTESPESLNFWIYGDGSGNLLTLDVQTAAGPQRLTALTLDFNGWQNALITLPEGTSAVTGIGLLCSGATSGTLYLDQFIASWGYYVDTVAPTVLLELGGGMARAVVSDALDSELLSKNISLTYDGAPLEYSYDATAKVLTAELPADDGLSHLLALTAADRSGNIARVAQLIATEAEEANPFADLQGHWAEPYTTYLYDQGVIGGTAKGDKLYYAPDTAMTRVRFAVFICSWLGVDTALYANTELPFADLDSVPSWALPQVKAVYAMNIIRGTAAADGKIYFNPNGSLTRAEAMTIIGRTQPRGYSESELPFSDAGSTPSWALPYVRSLVGQGAVGGSNGKLLPNDTITGAQVAKILCMLY